MMQLTGETVGEVQAVADMHQRKAEMAKRSDAFIALPGWCQHYFFLLTSTDSILLIRVSYD